LPAEAYHQAGADGILIHSKLSQPDEIIAFANEWRGRSPLIIVPTKYYSTPTEVFRKAGISLVIWANHMIRASIAAMKDISEQIAKHESVANVDDQIATVNEIFVLQGADELARAQEKYLKNKEEPHAIVLAASRGNALRELTQDRPKVMLSISGKPLLRRLVDEFKKQSINKITIVAGYKAEAIDDSGINLLINEDYESTGELSSLACAKESYHDDMLIMYGDLLFRPYILRDLLDANGDIVIVVDSALHQTHISGSPDFAYCSQTDDRSLFKPEIMLKQISDEEQLIQGKPSGRWIGMLRVRNAGKKWLDEAMLELQVRSDFRTLTIPDLLNHLVEQGKIIHVHYIHGHWLDINYLDDIDRAVDFTHGH